jgi:hypothetical protein
VGPRGLNAESEMTMPTIAELDELRRSPQVAYPEYAEIREQARRKARLPVDPREIPRMQQVIYGHTSDWCSSVLGYPFTGLGRISGTDADMLMIAHERGLDPLLPPWLVTWKEESAARQQLQDERREQGRARDREKWEHARAAGQAEVEVRPNVHGRRYGASWDDGPLRHAVPLADAVSARRRHPAGRALCESATRPQPLVLASPVDEPATCVNCIKYAAVIRPAGAGDSQPQVTGPSRPGAGPGFPAGLLPASRGTSARGRGRRPGPPSHGSGHPPAALW